MLVLAMMAMMAMMAMNNPLASAGVYRLDLAMMLSRLTVIPTSGCSTGKATGVFVHETEVWWPMEATARVACPTEAVMGEGQYVPMEGAVYGGSCRYDTGSVIRKEEE